MYSPASAQLTNKEKEELLRYSKEECPISMFKKFRQSPRYSSPEFTRLKKEIGQYQLEKDIIKPSLKFYCDCIGVSMYSGDKMSEALTTCTKGLDSKLKEQIATYGYY